MPPKVQDDIYIALFMANAALTACTETGVLPATWGHYAALASLVIAAMLPKFRGVPNG